jgi:ribosomal protein S18 acetylase RimI-like enzyme
MHLTIRQSKPADKTFAYEVKRAALGNYVEQTWGWNEQFQQRFHADDWANHPPDIIELDGNPIGTLEVLEHADHLFIGEFYILPEFQRRGIGTRLLREVLANADAKQLCTRLHFLKVNPVRSLYERHGFVVTGESDTHFFADRPVRPRGTNTGKPPGGAARKS